MRRVGAKWTRQRPRKLTILRGFRVGLGPAIDFWGLS